MYVSHWCVYHSCPLELCTGSYLMSFYTLSCNSLVQKPSMVSQCPLKNVGTPQLSLFFSMTSNEICYLASHNSWEVPVPAGPFVPCPFQPFQTLKCSVEPPLPLALASPPPWRFLGISWPDISFARLWALWRQGWNHTWILIAFKWIDLPF